MGFLWEATGSQRRLGEAGRSLSREAPGYRRCGVGLAGVSHGLRLCCWPGLYIRQCPVPTVASFIVLLSVPLTPCAPFSFTCPSVCLSVCLLKSPLGLPWCSSGWGSMHVRRRGHRLNLCRGTEILACHVVRPKKKKKIEKSLPFSVWVLALARPLPHQAGCPLLTAHLFPPPSLLCLPTPLSLPSSLPSVSLHLPVSESVSL